VRATEKIVRRSPIRINGFWFPCRWRSPFYSKSIPAIFDRLPFRLRENGIYLCGLSIQFLQKNGKGEEFQVFLGFKKLNFLGSWQQDRMAKFSSTFFLNLVKTLGESANSKGKSSRCKRVAPSYAFVWINSDSLCSDEVSS